MTWENALEASQLLEKKKFGVPDVAIILGTGLSGLIREIEIAHSIPYEEMPHFPVSTVESHTGRLILGFLKGRRVLVMQGRFHFYEGYTMQQVVFPVRVMKALGVVKLIIFNAAGAINRDFKKGNLMLITDHINLLPGNPLIGPNEERWGTRFPDMSRPYDSKMCDVILKGASTLKLNLYRGVYAAVPGPNLETRAEYRYLGRIGADAVGMSTVPEVIAANHMNIKCAAISVLTDECDPDNLHAVSLEEIIAVASKAEPELTRLISEIINLI